MTDLTQMTIEELEEHVSDCHIRYLYEEAAERGYNATAAHQAQKEWLDASRELRDRSKSILELAEDLKAACDQLTAI